MARRFANGDVIVSSEYEGGPRRLPTGSRIEHNGAVYRVPQWPDRVRDVTVTEHGELSVTFVGGRSRILDPRHDALTETAAGGSMGGHDPKAHGQIRYIVRAFGQWANGKHEVCVRRIRTEHPEVAAGKDLNALCAWLKDQWAGTTKWRGRGDDPQQAAEDKAIRARASRTARARFSESMPVALAPAELDMLTEDVRTLTGISPLDVLQTVHDAAAGLGADPSDAAVFEALWEHDVNESSRLIAVSEAGLATALRRRDPVMMEEHLATWLACHGVPGTITEDEDGVADAARLVLSGRQMAARGTLGRLVEQCRAVAVEDVGDDEDFDPLAEAFASSQPVRVTKGHGQLVTEAAGLLAEFDMHTRERLDALNGCTPHQVGRVIAKLREAMRACSHGHMNAPNLRHCKTCGEKLIHEATLSAKRRDNLDDRDFALPGRRYPIHDEAHARNALSRVAQYGTSEEKSKVRAAVKRRHPTIGRMREHEPGEDVIADEGLAEHELEAVFLDVPDPAALVEATNYRANAMKYAGPGGGIGSGKHENIGSGKGRKYPAGFQHLRNELMDKRGMSVSKASRVAYGALRRWASGRGSVKGSTRRKAAKVLTQLAAHEADILAESRVTDVDPEVVTMRELLDRIGSPFDPEQVRAIAEQAGWSLRQYDRDGVFALTSAMAPSLVVKYAANGVVGTPVVPVDVMAEAAVDDPPGVLMELQHVSGYTTRSGKKVSEYVRGGNGHKFKVGAMVHAVGKDGSPVAGRLGVSAGKVMVAGKEVKDVRGQGAPSKLAVKSYDPGTGPSAAEKAANARIMRGSVRVADRARAAAHGGAPPPKGDAPAASADRREPAAPPVPAGGLRVIVNSRPVPYGTWEQAARAFGDARGKNVRVKAIDRKGGTQERDLSTEERDHLVRLAARHVMSKQGGAPASTAVPGDVKSRVAAIKPGETRDLGGGVTVRHPRPGVYYVRTPTGTSRETSADAAAGRVAPHLRNLTGLERGPDEDVPHIAIKGGAAQPGSWVEFTRTADTPTSIEWMPGIVTKVVPGGNIRVRDETGIELWMDPKRLKLAKRQPPPRPKTLPGGTAGEGPLGETQPRWDDDTAERLDAQNAFESPDAIERIISSDPGVDRDAAEARFRAAKRDLGALNKALNTTVGDDMAKWLNRKKSRDESYRAQLLSGDLTLEDARELFLDDYRDAEHRRLEREYRKNFLQYRSVPCPSCGHFKSRASAVCNYCGDDPVSRNYDGTDATEREARIRFDEGYYGY
jgi:ribosomal protein L32